VSHHIHCNDDALDEDVMSAFPLLRFDPRLPRAWYHRYQHIYMVGGWGGGGGGPAVGASAA
jgi:fatty acid desaturase (delta-4 desaturase)